MTNVIIHGCNGKMGHTILDLLKDDEEITVVAGVDTFDEGKNSFPVFSDIRQCDVRGDGGWVMGKRGGPSFPSLTGITTTLAHLFTK